MIKKILIWIMLCVTSVVFTSVALGVNDIVLFTQTPNSYGFTWSSGGENNLVANFVKVNPPSHWRAIAGLPVACKESRAATLNGKVYSIGGYGRTNNYCFDGTVWKGVKEPPFACSQISSAATCGNYIYFARGYNVRNFARFDGKTWDTLTSFPFSSYWRIGTLTNTVVATCGGTNFAQYVGGEWASSLPNNPLPLANLAEIDGSVYEMDLGGFATNMYRYQGGVWSAVAAKPTAKIYNALTSDGTKIYLIGGCTDGSAGDAFTNVFTFDGTTWTEIEGLPMALCETTATVLNGEVYTWGSVSDNYPRTNVFVYGPTPP